MAKAEIEKTDKLFPDDHIYKARRGSNLTRLNLELHELERKLSTASALKDALINAIGGSVIISSLTLGLGIDYEKTVIGTITAGTLYFIGKAAMRVVIFKHIEGTVNLAP